MKHIEIEQNQTKHIEIKTKQMEYEGFLLFE